VIFPRLECTECEDYTSPADKADGGETRQARAARQELLGNYPQRDRDHPDIAHDASDEEKRHQRPAATEARDAVAQSPHENARAARLGTLGGGCAAA